MGSLRLWFLLGMILVGVIRTEAADDGPPKRAENEPRIGTSFVTIGRYYINLSRLNYIVSKDDGLVLVFEGDGRGQLTLKDEHAEAMRRWLEERPAFIEIGPYHINLGCLDYVANSHNSLQLRFKGDEKGELLLSGSEADAMKRWLDARSLGPQMGQRPQQGDSIRQPGSNRR